MGCSASAAFKPDERTVEEVEAETNRTATEFAALWFLIRSVARRAAAVAAELAAASPSDARLAAAAAAAATANQDVCAGLLVDLVVVGGSKAGKSTLVNALLGLVPHVALAVASSEPETFCPWRMVWSPTPRVRHLRPAGRGVECLREVTADTPAELAVALRSAFTRASATAGPGGIASPLLPHTPSDVPLAPAASPLPPCPQPPSSPPSPDGRGVTPPPTGPPASSSCGSGADGGSGSAPPPDGTSPSSAPPAGGAAGQPPLCLPESLRGTDAAWEAAVRAAAGGGPSGMEAAGAGDYLEIGVDAPLLRPSSAGEAICVIDTPGLSERGANEVVLAHARGRPAVFLFCVDMSRPSSDFTDGQELLVALPPNRVLYALTRMDMLFHNTAMSFPDQGLSDEAFSHAVAAEVTAIVARVRARIHARHPGALVVPVAAGGMGQERKWAKSGSAQYIPYAAVVDAVARLRAAVRERVQRGAMPLVATAREAQVTAAVTHTVDAELRANHGGSSADTRRRELADGVAGECAAAVAAAEKDVCERLAAVGQELCGMIRSLVDTHAGTAMLQTTYRTELTTRVCEAVQPIATARVRDECDAVARAFSARVTAAARRAATHVDPSLPAVGDTPGGPSAQELGAAEKRMMVLGGVVVGSSSFVGGLSLVLFSELAIGRALMAVGGALGGLAGLLVGTGVGLVVHAVGWSPAAVRANVRDNMCAGVERAMADIAARFAAAARAEADAALAAAQRWLLGGGDLRLVAAEHPGMQAVAELLEMRDALAAHARPSQPPDAAAACGVAAAKCAT